MIRGKMKTLFIVAATVLCLSACTNVIGGSDAQEDDRESQTEEEVQKAMQKPFEKLAEFKGGFKVERIR